MVASLNFRERALDPAFDTRIRTAATDIGNGVRYFGAGWLRLILQQSRHRHDHSGLTVSALGYLFCDPRLLYWMAVIDR